MRRRPEQSLLEIGIAEAGGPDAFAALVAALPEDQQLHLVHDWSLLGRPSQLTPAGSWRTWLVLPFLQHSAGTAKVGKVSAVPAIP